MGDTLGGACGNAFFEGQLQGSVNHPNFSNCSRQKIAENNSPMPRDRVFFAFNHFHNPIMNSVSDNDGPGDPVFLNSDTNVDRYTIGFEKTFLEEVFSIEVRLPVVDQLGTSLYYDFGTPPSVPSQRDLQLGNVTVALKSLIYSNTSGFHVSGGLLLETPTSDDVQIRAREAFVDDEDGLPPTPDDVTADYFFHYDNDATFIAPFLAFLYQPDAPFFVQGFWQTDMPVNGSDLNIEILQTFNGAPSQFVDSVHFNGEAAMRFDLGAGVYLYRNPGRQGFLQALAFQVEMHYSTTIEDSEVFSINTDLFGNADLTNGLDPDAEILLGNVNNRMDILNITFGPTAILENGTTLAAGFVLPTDKGDEKPFDFEFQFQANRYF